MSTVSSERRRFPETDVAARFLERVLGEQRCLHVRRALMLLIRRDPCRAASMVDYLRHAFVVEGRGLKAYERLCHDPSVAPRYLEVVRIALALPEAGRRRFFDTLSAVIGAWSLTILDQAVASSRTIPSGTPR